MDIFARFGQYAPTPLCEIMSRHGCDKARTTSSSRHNYTHYYYRLFENDRDKPFRILEVGIGTGASLRGWKEFFPNAKVFGVDINPQTLFTEDRISTFVCDVTLPDSIARLWLDPALVSPIDIIVDDGRHTMESQVAFFENSIHKLAAGGVYVIEDVRTNVLSEFSRKVSEWTRLLALRARVLSLRPEGNLYDNNLIAFQRA